MNQGNLHPMKYRIISLFSLLGILAFLQSCALVPQQLVKKVETRSRDSTVYLKSHSGKPEILGSGFFVDKDKIATNIHVVGQPGPIFAKLRSKETVLAFTIKGIAAFDVKNNLVILQLSDEGTPLPIGDSDTVHIDESVTVTGYTNGKFNAKTGTIDSIEKSDKWFWMKVATTEQSSGGPVLNKQGEVIGINVGYGDDFHNYVIPSNALKVLLAKTVLQEPLVEWQKREYIRAEVHNFQGEQKLDVKEYKNAIDEFGETITLNPEHFRASYRRGVAKFYRNDYAGALDDSTHAIKLNPKYARAYKGRCIMLCKLGDIELERGDKETARKFYFEGIGEFDKYIQLNKSDTVHASAAHKDYKLGRNSTVRVMSVSGRFAAGSGFFVDTDMIATNIHNVSRQGLKFVKLTDKKTIWEVTGVTAFNVDHDLVILKINGEGIPLPIGNSNLIRKGQLVVAVGYPDGKYKVTTGKVKAIRNSDKWISTTAKIAKGNSGGPLLNDNGKVIGINTRGDKYSASPSNILTELLESSKTVEPLSIWQKRDHIRACAYYFEGESKYFEGGFNKAIELFDKAILHNPNFLLAYRYRGYAKKALGYTDNADKDFKKARELESKK